MWGVCLDFGTVQAGLFQTVIQYEINDAANYENGKATILAPVTNLTIDADKIKRLEEAGPSVRRTGFSQEPSGSDWRCHRYLLAF